MWKKTEESEPSFTGSSPAPPRNSSTSSGSTSIIGTSIRIRGDLTGSEDLVIEGQIEGEVRFTDNRVTVGKNGRIRADIHGHSVTVDGEVKGDLYGGQEVVIRAAGRVKGNIVSPRVTLENGSKFKGAIDMEPSTKAEPAPSKPAAASSAKSPAPKPASDKPAAPAVTEPEQASAAGRS